MMDNIIYLTDYKQKTFKFSKKSIPRDFYYGIDLLTKNHKVITYDIGKIRIPQNIFFKILSKISFIFIGVYGTLTNELIKFFKKIPQGTKIICANDGIGFCCLLINFLLKKDFKIYILSMGFYSQYFYKRNKLLFLRKISVNFLLTKSKKILFLGSEELLFFKKTFLKRATKAVFFHFRIDDVFWSKREEKSLKSKPYILFLGNDKRRDFKIVFDISKKLKNLKIRIISNQYKKLFKKVTKNIIISG